MSENDAARDDEPENDPSLIGRRLLAYTVDVGLLAAVLMSAHFLLFGLATGGELPAWTHNGLLLWAFVLATYSLPTWLYFTLLESSPRGATLGKRLLRLRVVGPGDERIGFGRALLRTAFKLLPWEVLHASLMLPVPLFLAEKPELMARPGLIVHFFLVTAWLMTALLTRGNQGVHDLAAKTWVVREGDQGSIVRRSEASPSTLQK